MFYFGISKECIIFVVLSKTSSNNQLKQRIMRTEENNYYVIASCIGGWNQNPMFSGTYEECVEYMESNPALGYGNDNTGIYPEDEWEVDYL